MCDNSTAVAYINAMGGTHSVKCNTTTRKIWQWCIRRGIWLTCRFLPGKSNTKADRLSRRFNTNTEWMWDPSIFQSITSIWGVPDIDLFASSLNKQTALYGSWKPDINAAVVDAFSVTWTDYFCYAFPPFSMILRCLQKIKQERATGILIVPNWPTQAWFTMLLNMTTDTPRRLPTTETLLFLPGVLRRSPHPLGSKLQLLACHLSGRPLKPKGSQIKQSILFHPPGEEVPIGSMPRIKDAGLPLQHLRNVCFPRL